MLLTKKRKRQLELYMKARYVILSCETFDQASHALRYIRLAESKLHKIQYGILQKLLLNHMDYLLAKEAGEVLF